jgi:acid phosphatase type 7
LYPDTLAYFYYWAQPLNGPLTQVGAASTPTLSGAEANQKAFLAAAGSTYPRMANFSFDYGNAHWTVLDANGYVDWDDPALRAWVEKDLAAAKKATWRFVGFHHPGFNSSKNHFSEQHMRKLSDVFEKGGVDIVFAGHVHNYQRTFPLRFAVKRGPDGKPVVEERSIVGELKLDKNYDGQTRTKPDGVIYLVTGAGGASLYNPEQQNDSASWQPFTTKFIADTHSFTVVDADGTSLRVRQVSVEGKELDRFTVSR